jgi:tRNA U34 5-methylaminomethyl-2-thiouridine-forming methyltransferase MnmC
MDPEGFTLHQTADGTGTLYSSKMQESYHSLNGAAQESRHVFIEAGLKQCPATSIHVFEIGFGTGLNALLTWGEAKRDHLDVTYTAVEAYPLPLETTASLGYESLEPLLTKDAFSNLHVSPWECPVVLEKGCFTLCKLKGDFTTQNLTDTFDLIYFDAFAPDKQPEMWEEPLFAALYASMNENGILVTYCAKGEVRRRLQRCGFLVERIPGPPGKREMLRAIKTTLQNEKKTVAESPSRAKNIILG